MQDFNEEIEQERLKREHAELLARLEKRRKSIMETSTYKPDKQTELDTIALVQRNGIVGHLLMREIEKMGDKLDDVRNTTDALMELTYLKGGPATQHGVRQWAGSLNDGREMRIQTAKERLGVWRVFWENNGKWVTVIVVVTLYLVAEAFGLDLSDISLPFLG